MKRTTYGYILLMLILGGCSSTSVTSSWKATDANLKQYSKLLIIGIMSDTNRDLRQSMEKELVLDLKAKGQNAVSAFDEFGPKAFKRMTEQQVNDQIKKKGYDGVITITMLNKQKEKYYVPGSMYYTPFSYDYGYFWGYYSGIYDRVYEPGYYESGTNYLWESNLFDLDKGKLIYSVQSNSFDPYNTQTLGKDYGKSIARDMVKNGLLMKK